jgi:hypothetical protein
MPYDALATGYLKDTFFSNTNITATYILDVEAISLSFDIIHLIELCKDTIIQ